MSNLLWSGEGNSDQSSFLLCGPSYLSSRPNGARIGEMEASVSARVMGDDDNSIGTGYNSNNVKKARLNSTLSALLEDPILMDVPKKPTLSDVDTLISLELGSAMRISVLKLDGTSFDVVVMNSATVKVLKLAIKKKINEMEQSKMGHRHISWRHVWANFCLSYHNDKLLDDNSALQDFGIRNNSQVQFVPYVVARASWRHSRRRKHRFFHGLSKTPLRPKAPTDVKAFFHLYSNMDS